LPIDFRPKKFQKTRSNKSDATDNEQKVAEQLDMRTTVGSGNKDRDKGDLSSSNFLVEMKQTKHKSIVLQREWIEKIHQEAYDKDKYWGLYVGFTDQNNDIKQEGVMISMYLFNRLKYILEQGEQKCL
jgi:hypothetical protein